MEVYYLLSFLFLLTSFLLRKNKERLSYTLFLYVLIVIGFRHQSMGHDLLWNVSGGYLDWFDTISRSRLVDLPELSLLTFYDLGYVFLNYVIGLFTNERQALLFVCASISILPFASYTSRESKNPLLSVAIFVGLPSFLLLYSALRQVVATGILVLSIPYLINRDKRFFVYLIIASLFHAISIVFIIAYYIYRYRAKSFSKYLSVIFLIMTYFLNNVLFAVILPYIFVGEYEIDNSSSVLSFIVFSLIYIGLIFAVYEKSSPHIRGYINIFYVACLCLAFQSITSVAVRVSSLFMFPLMIIIPDYIFHLRNKKLAFISTFFCLIIFMGYGLYRINAGGSDYAQSSPYYWFWEDVKD